MKKIAIYPLSGDPIHNGHVYNIATVMKDNLFDEFIIAIGNDPRKKYLFNSDERVSLAKKVISSLENKNINTKITVGYFSGLLRNYAKQKGADYIIRGCRNQNDWEYEEFLSDFNGEYGLQTIVLPSTKEIRNISSTYIKTILNDGTFIHKLVHPAVKQALEEKILGISLIGVTGNMGCGKSTFCEKLVEYSKNTNTKITHIDFDKLVHSIYNENDPINLEAKEKIKKRFGDDVFFEEKLNRKKLAEIIFNNEKSKQELEEILKIPSMIKLEQAIKDKKGIILLDAAYLTEYNMLPLVNYNTILIGCEEQERYKRIYNRDKITQKELESRVNAQHTYKLKKSIIQESQNQIKHGFLYEVDTTNETNFKEILEKINSNFPMKDYGGKNDK